MKTELITALVPVYDTGLFLKNVESLNTKALKANLSGIEWSKKEDILEYDDILGKSKIIGSMYELTYEEIKLSGDWELIAVLDHKEGLVKVLPEKELPVCYRDNKNVCDHCGYDRKRNETFVIWSKKEGYKQIGRQCLGMFLGIDASTVLAQIDWAKEFDPDKEEDGMKIGGSVSSFSLGRVVQYGCAAIRLYGWISGTMAKDSMEQSTASTVWFALTARNQKELDKVGKKGFNCTEDDNILAVKVCEWMKELVNRSNLNDYMYNLCVIGQNETVSDKSKGYAVSAIMAYLKEEGKKIDSTVKAKENGLKFLGKIGEKLTVTATLIRSGGYDTQYGYTLIHNFVCEDGNTIVWSTQKELLIGGKFCLIGTVKDHKEWSGILQTVLTRVRPIIIVE